MSFASGQTWAIRRGINCRLRLDDSRRTDDKPPSLHCCKSRMTTRREPRQVVSQCGKERRRFYALEREEAGRAKGAAGAAAERALSGMCTESVRNSGDS